MHTTRLTVCVCVCVCVCVWCGVCVLVVVVCVCVLVVVVVCVCVWVGGGGVVVVCGWYGVFSHTTDKAAPVLKRAITLDPESKMQSACACVCMRACVCVRVCARLSVCVFKLPYCFLYTCANRLCYCEWVCSECSPHHSSFCVSFYSLAVNVLFVCSLC